MKKILFFFLVIFVASCSDNGSTTTTDSKDSNVATTETDYSTYPYSIKNPDTWETGDEQHTLNVLKSLKAFEDGKIDECVSYFADSVRLRFDEMDQKVSKDTLKALFTKWRSGYKSMKIEMGDWES